MANSRDDHGSSGVSTILIDAAKSFGSPSWIVQKLFMQHQPSALLPATLNLTSRPVVPPGPSGSGTITSGCCGDTDTGKDCNSDPKGAWSAKEKNITDLAGCVAAVRGCRYGNFASFATDLVGDDCSWYASCNMGHLLHPPNHYESEIVRGDSDSWACTGWANGGTCSAGTRAMLAASVSLGASGELQAKIVNSTERTPLN